MVQGLEKRRGIRPGTQVLATRGPPSAGRVGNEAQNQAWDLGFGNTRKFQLGVFAFFRTLCAHLLGENASQERCCCSPAAQRHSFATKPFPARVWKILTNVAF